MIVSIVSCFRNSATYIQRYCTQMEGLQEELKKRGHQLNLVLGYGDSTDNTDDILQNSNYLDNLDTKLYDVSHGGKHYGSVVHPTRFKQLSYVGNTLWSHLPKRVDVVGLVESDLIWEPEALSKLVEATRSLDMVAPMVLHQNDHFYDTWAFILNGKNFRYNPPYHRELLQGEQYEDYIYEMDSVGSCFFMQAEIAFKVHWPPEDVVVGLCRQVREDGYSIYLLREAKVYHP